MEEQKASKQARQMLNEAAGRGNVDHEFDLMMEKYKLSSKDASPH